MPSQDGSTAWPLRRTVACLRGEQTPAVNSESVRRSRHACRQITSLSNIVAIDAGHSHSVAITHTGEVYAWGANEHGQLGDGSRKDRRSPVRIALDHVWRSPPVATTRWRSIVTVRCIRGALARADSSEPDRPHWLLSPPASTACSHLRSPRDGTSPPRSVATARWSCGARMIPDNSAMARGSTGPRRWLDRD